VALANARSHHRYGAALGGGAGCSPSFATIRTFERSSRAGSSSTPRRSRSEKTLHETLNPLASGPARKGCGSTCEVDPWCRTRWSATRSASPDPDQSGRQPIKFTRVGSVTVTVGVDGPQDADQTMVHFAIADTGIGIAPEKHALIFEPFRQADGSTPASSEETGLGLAICGTLVQVFGGRPSWVGERHVREYVPFHGAVERESVARVAPSSARGAEPRVSLRCSSRGQTGQSDGREAVLGALGPGRGHRRDGREGRRGARASEVDVILMDVQMPEVNGFEATAANPRGGGHIGRGHAIVAMTAHAMNGDREGAWPRAWTTTSEADRSRNPVRCDRSGCVSWRRCLFLGIRFQVNQRPTKAMPAPPHYRSSCFGTRRPGSHPV